MSGDKPRKVYKKIYRKRGYNINGSKRKELTDEQRANQLYNLKYGRICMAYAMEGLPKPEKVIEEFSHVEDVPGKGNGKAYVFKGYKDGKLGNHRFIVGLNGKKPKKTKTTNYFYY